MFFEFRNVIISQRFGNEKPIPVTKKGFDFSILMSKINLSTDFYNVLRHHDDFDRLSTMKILFLD